MDEFISLLDGHRKNEQLRPKRSVKNSIVQMFLRMAPGDHIAFRFWGIYHHGIVLERPDDMLSWFVADFSSPSGDIFMRDAELRRRPLHDFLREVVDIWVIHYDGHGVCDTVKIANFMVAKKLHTKAPYHCLRNNCETFAVFCKTGYLDNGGSERGRIIGDVIRRDLEHKNKFFLMNVLGSLILHIRRLLSLTL